MPQRDASLLLATSQITSEEGKILMKNKWYEIVEIDDD
jgi:hypothetical protein